MFLYRQLAFPSSVMQFSDGISYGKWTWIHIPIELIQNRNTLSCGDPDLDHNTDKQHISGLKINFLYSGK
jgi:hypothetical protein